MAIVQFKSGSYLLNITRVNVSTTRDFNVRIQIHSIPFQIRKVQLFKT